MDNSPEQNPEALEERIRRMILSGSAAVARQDDPPEVRLSPPTRGYNAYPQSAQINDGFSQSNNVHAHQYHRIIQIPDIQGASHSSPDHVRAQPRFGPALQHQQYRAQQGSRNWGFPGRSTGGNYRPQRQQRQQTVELDPSAFARGGQAQSPRPPFDSNKSTRNFPGEHTGWHELQAQYMQQIVKRELEEVEMSLSEQSQKESFRIALQQLCHDVCNEDNNFPTVDLECFGSFASGFASAGSDMDLAIVVNNQDSAPTMISLLGNDFPRALEKKLLDNGYGARLLTRTRVPIIKVCQSPSLSLLDKLRAERERWEQLPNEEKHPHLFPGDDENEGHAGVKASGAANDKSINSTDVDTVTADAHQRRSTDNIERNAAGSGDEGKPTGGQDNCSQSFIKTSTTASVDYSEQLRHRREPQKTWTRERKAGPLDFPKGGVGIQCDINFFNPLGLHNTKMLRCYSLCDPRVRSIVLCVKSWAKLRGVNSSYSGTLSSYGYVLMVLHYLANVVRPPVVPNLQLPWRPNPKCTQHGANKVEVDNWVVDFWQNENEIQAAWQHGQMSSNNESVGSLLAGFFRYYSSLGSGPQFRWTGWVLSLRTPGGIVTKQSKGWVKATTEEGKGKRVQNRYLFCIEDPFELSHNVARTVTHNGIVAIRDEFRRAYRILDAVGRDAPPHDGDLFTKLVEADEDAGAIGGPGLVVQTAPPADSQPDASTTQHTLRDTEPGRSQPMRSNRPSVKHSPMHTSKQQSNTLDLASAEAFPSLGVASAQKSVSRFKKASKNSAAISGEEAQAHLEEFRRKKAESEAERTANQSAEWVLHD